MSDNRLSDNRSSGNRSSGKPTVLVLGPGGSGRTHRLRDLAPAGAVWLTASPFRWLSRSAVDDALVRARAFDEPALVVDDVQWADAEALDSDSDETEEDLEEAAELDAEVEEDEEPQDWEESDVDEEEELGAEAADDPSASRRFWFEHATGAGKTVAAVGFIEASRTGGVLILTHRRNLVDQFIGEISDRGYADRLSPALLRDQDHPYGPVTVETYQWFVRNAGKVSGAYSIVICDEAHTALGEKTSGCIRSWREPVFIGMTATGALICACGA